MFRLVTLIFFLSSCGNIEPTRQQTYCNGETFLLDGYEILNHHQCYIKDTKAVFKLIYDQDRVGWLRNVITIPVNIENITVNEYYDAAKHISELSLTTIDALGNTAIVANYSKQISFDGAFLVREDYGMDLCIRAALGLPGKTKPVRINITESVLCRNEN